MHICTYISVYMHIYTHIFINIYTYRERESLFGFYGVSPFIGNVMLNPFLYKEKIQFQTIQFSISIVFVYTHLNVKILLFQTIQFSVIIVSRSKTVPF